MSKVDKVKQKIKKEHEVFASTLEPLNVEDLKKNILIYTKYLQETLYMLKNNKDLKEAELELKKAKNPFSSKIKENKDKIKQLKSFVDDSVCVEDLELQMIKYAMDAEDQAIKMDESDSVKNAKDAVEMIKGPLNDAKSVLGLKISFINILINEKEGFEPGFRDEE